MEKKEIKIILKDGGVAPRYCSELAHGADVYANNEVPIVLHPGDRALIPTGVYFDLPEDVEVQVRPRSGLALKQGITVLNSPGTIDPDYQGECKVILINHGDKNFIVNRGERIAQFVFVHNIIQADFVQVEDFANETERGEGGFHSTGSK